ncbi:helix-turn-helix domain-containing protein [Streptomyces sp. NPDC002588]|uniref:ArsR/SmtB family transcription factor n=1 Tax=Streptomyces sp. NPDC002588 TaxID=3154419 RepID=UPI00332672F9
MLRIHLSPEGLSSIRFAPRPAPLYELNAALMMLCRTESDPLFGRWQRRIRHSLGDTTRPLGDLVSAVRCPEFVIVPGDTVAEGQRVMRNVPLGLLRSGIEMMYPARTSRIPRWIRDLHRGHAESWQLLFRAQRDAYETILRPSWSAVQDLHRTEFTRHALTTAEHGIGGALVRLLPGSRLHEGVWEIDTPRHRDIRLGGQGAVLVPTFHWTGYPLVSDRPGQPVLLVYPAGSGLAFPPATSIGDTLANILGQTRANLLRLLSDEHTTSDAARRLGVSNATVSEHTTALRRAGLITTVRAGRAVLHNRTPLGALLCTRL